MTEQRFYDRAISLLKQALDHEDRHRPAEAIQKYVDALDYFLAGYRYDANEERKAVVLER